MAEISIQEIEASAHASAIATGGHGPFISVRAESCMPGIGKERRAKRVCSFSISIAIAISDCDIASRKKCSASRPKVENVVCAESFMSGIGTDRLRYAIATERSGAERSGAERSDCD